MYATASKSFIGSQVAQSKVEEYNGASITAKELTAFDALFQSIYGVKAVQGRVEALAVKFFGPMPEADGGSQPYSGGLIGGITHATDNINAAVTRMHDLLNSIERALP